MEDNQERSLPKCALIIHEDLTEADNITPSVCPLCKSVLQLYQIHFDEKFLMCGNVECPYPIGIADYHIYKTECSEEVNRSDNNSIGGSSVTSGSATSFTDWCDIEKSMHTTPFSPSSTPPRSLIEEPEDIEKLAKVKETIHKEQLLRNNVKKIQELNKKLFDTDDGLDNIRNKKWIKHIAEMQARSGVRVLKEHELNKVRPKISVGELKIDVDSMKKEISLKIEFDDKNDQK